MSGDLYSGIAVDWAKRYSVNFVQVNAAQRSSADFAESETPSFLRGVALKIVFTGNPGQYRSFGKLCVGGRCAAESFSTARAMTGTRIRQITVDPVAH